jgi:uncharacterized protein (DUF924 family)
MSLPQDILQYWFEGVDDSVLINKNKPPFNKWFFAGEKIDDEIRRKFKVDLEKASRGELRAWEKDPRERLALIILFDQFSRNMFRHTAQMYEYDPQALELSQRTIKEGSQKNLQLIERVFLYMPLMHTEDLKLQQLSVDKFVELVEGSKNECPANTSYFEYNLKYALKHQETIERFGRFPQRNVILKRESTSDEEIFIHQ